LSSETKLVQDYEAIRRREYELISGLLEVLPRVDHLDEARINQVRDALFHADHPFLMVFVGPFSAGKSSLINALLGKSDLLPVGPIPTTDRIAILRYGEQAQRMNSGGEFDTVFYPSPLLQKVSLVDTPGLQSVMQRHEATTRAFLHRSDLVFLTMLATQAMTASNLEYLQTLKQYGKKVILLISQADLLSADEAEKVKVYVQEQSQIHLGYKPDLWLVSSHKAMDARRIPADNVGDALGQALGGGKQNDIPVPQGVVNADLWRASGLWQFEHYIDQQLGDVDRLKQKLQTPLQIIQSANTLALNAVRANQSIIDTYQGIGDNIEQQLAVSKREQEKLVKETITEAREKFTHTAERGNKVIGDTFALSQSFKTVLRGVSELFMIGRILRTMRGKSEIDEAFDAQKVFEPLNELGPVVDKLGPRLEGKDTQDIDGLVKYAQREITSLPAAIQSKVIGAIQAPLQYDRSALQSIRTDLNRIEDSARQAETHRIQQSLYNSLLTLGVCLVIMVAFLVGVVILRGPWGNTLENDTVPLILILVLVGLILGSVGVMPLFGAGHQREYTKRLLKLQNDYADTLARAADKQVEYGMRQRREAIAPLMRLIEAQTTIQREQVTKLQKAQQEMIQIESDLTTFGKKNILGM
jgi:GTP-binding protein EngB required for normal cell division